MLAAYNLVAINTSQVFIAGLVPNTFLGTSWWEFLFTRLRLSKSEGSHLLKNLRGYWAWYCVKITIAYPGYPFRTVISFKAQLGQRLRCFAPICSSSSPPFIFSDSCRKYLQKSIFLTSKRYKHLILCWTLLLLQYVVCQGKKQNRQVACLFQWLEVVANLVGQECQEKNKKSVKDT